MRTLLAGLLLSVTLLAVLSRPGLLVGDAPVAVDFAKDIRPIFAAHCVSCHGPDKQRGDLRLDDKAAALKGSDTGAVIVPGKSATSPLVDRVATKDAKLRMPPPSKGQPLSSEQIAKLKAWIDQGAMWPEEATADAKKKHWSFQPVVRPVIPPSPDPTWARNPIDHFISAQLASKELQPSSEASRVTLLRRLKFDLLGLPPTLDELDELQSDKSPDWYEKLVDRFLASPHFGERWARHWLDVVRFAESTGFETNVARSTAWPYRDYVIRALNDDKPYDQFIHDQIAGDDEATGYLVAGAYDNVKGDPLLISQQRADELHDMVSTTGSAFFGLTVGCARCHNHKFDPITQRDYYGMKALFAGVQHGERRLAASATVANPRKNEERFTPVEAKFVRMTILETTDGAEPCIDELEVFAVGDEARNVALAKHGTRATASTTLPGHAIHKLEFVNDGRPGNHRSWISSEPGRGWVQLEFPEAIRIDRIVWSRDRIDGGFTDRLAASYRFEVAVKPGAWHTVASRERSGRWQATMLPPVVYAGRFTAPEPTHLLFRGDVREQRELVPPAALAEFGAKLQMPADAPERDRRHALAKWITDPNHPLTARVLVNRLWQQHFGKGIVDTPSDFGRNGARPTHPELLDWLAGDFMASGWRMKHIHRLIVLSSTYRQASATNPTALAADAQTRLLWRYPPRRLEAEPLRDTLLAVTGKLDLRMGGPGFDLFQSNGNYVKLYTPKTVFGPAEWRRMIYHSKPRMRLDDTFGAFDCPDAGQTSPKRTGSTTALQMLNLLNSPFMQQQFGFFAERIQREAEDDPAAQVCRGYLLAYQRAPDADEIADAVKLVKEHGLLAFCRAVLVSSEFMYVY